MEEWIVKIALKAGSKKEAESIASDSMRIRNALSQADHKSLADLLEQNPGIVQTAKKMLGK